MVGALGTDEDVSITRALSLMWSVCSLVSGICHTHLTAGNGADA